MKRREFDALLKTAPDPVTPRLAREFRSIEGIRFTVCLVCAMRAMVAAAEKGIPDHEATVPTFTESVDDHFAQAHPDDAAVAEELKMLYTKMATRIVMGDEEL
jgi:hypothetical protein